MGIVGVVVICLEKLKNEPDIHFLIGIVAVVKQQL
jgi:hypothetical protein